MFKGKVRVIEEFAFPEPTFLPADSDMLPTRKKIHSPPRLTSCSACDEGCEFTYGRCSSRGNWCGWGTGGERVVGCDDYFLYFFVSPFYSVGSDTRLLRSLSSSSAPRTQTCPRVIALFRSPAYWLISSQQGFQEGDVRCDVFDAGMDVNKIEGR